MVFKEITNGEENLKVEFGATRSKKDQRIQVRLLDPQARTSNLRKGKDCQSKRFTRSPRTNWKNCGTTSSKTKNEDG